VRCYSITVLFNTPAARFKEKLGAQVVELRVFIELLRRVRLDMRLRDYRRGKSVALQGRSQRG
jgi:hypothetical protein